MRQRPSMPGSSHLAALAIALTSLLVSCGGGAEDVHAAEEGSVRPARVRSFNRLEDPRVVECREALEFGRLERGSELLRELRRAIDLGVEAHLLEARAAALLGKTTVVSQLIEEARRIEPEDPRVFATSAELHAAAGRLDTAESEIRRGLEVCGAAPELTRARGVHMICQPGGADVGLRLFERALELDPDLPFTSRAQAQAHLLVGRHELGQGDGLAALEHAYASLDLDPEERDAQRFLAEALSAVGELGKAIVQYRQLVEAGEQLEVELAMTLKNAGVAGLLQGKREIALEYFVEARARGLSELELGSGAHALQAEAGRRLAQATAAYDEGDVDRAEALAMEAERLAIDPVPARIERAVFAVHRGVEALRAKDHARAEAQLLAAVQLDADSLQARNYLAHTLLADERPLEAAVQWQRVVDIARQGDLQLPEPVHLSLAHAHGQAGDTSRARATLEAYLLEEPEGEWREQTLELLRKLPDQGDEASGG